MKLQNQALLLKFLDKFYNRADLQWVQLIWSTYYQDSVPHATDRCGSFWWKSIMKLSPIYRGISSCIIGQGSSALFWKDDWGNNILEEKYPCLFSYVLKEDISVSEFCNTTEASDKFHLPLSPEALQEWQHIQQSITNNLQLSDEIDSWKYQWGG